MGCSWQPSDGLSIPHRIDFRLAKRQVPGKNTHAFSCASFSRVFFLFSTLNIAALAWAKAQLVIVLEAASMRSHTTCELCSTCRTKQTTVVVRNASDRRQPNGCGLLTP